MFSLFTGFIQKTHLFEPHEKVMLAVSGGIDSMVLLHLFERSGFNYGVVHCNFQLRDDDSMHDELFVREQVLQHGVPFYSTRFETKEHAALNGISIEMAARELRYEYFEQIRFKNNYDYIATAHHQDDVLETFFLNLSRKTGIRGLTGIREKSGRIIRPLLFASRRNIEEYARLNGVESREDRTNSEMIYQRNYIRHHVIPAFTALNPSFKGSLAETVSNLREAEEVYSFFLNRAKEQVMQPQQNGWVIHISSLMEFPFPKVLLYEILLEFGFNPAIARQVYLSLSGLPGKQFYSKTHRLVKDRESLFVTPLSQDEERIFYVEEDDIELFAPFDLTVEKKDAANFSIIKSPEVACIDMEKVEFPLHIRKWKQGDYFCPLGMTGYKKVSDFLIDNKVPVHLKENTWVLCSGQDIVWVMGYRLDNRFRIAPETKRIMIVKVKLEN
jgi:tRNA(Ile)-lysidine synthase